MHINTKYIFYIELTRKLWTLKINITIIHTCKHRMGQYCNKHLCSVYNLQIHLWISTFSHPSYMQETTKTKKKNTLHNLFYPFLIPSNVQWVMTYITQNAPPLIGTHSTQCSNTLIPRHTKRTIKLQTDQN